MDGIGDIAGIPLLTSRAAANKVILIDAARLAVVDDGLEIDFSGAASVQLYDNPSAGPLSLVSAWQTNSAFIRLTRFLSWTLAANDAVAFTEISELAGSPA